jgi:hypothetical protein
MSTADTTETTAMIKLLSEHYHAIPAPVPSAALAARMEAGAVALDTPTPEARIDELAARRRGRDVAATFRDGARRRTRFLVAGVAAAFFASSGLAAAGVLPDPVQREISSVVSRLGIDIPSPVESPVSGSVTHELLVAPNAPRVTPEPAIVSTAPADVVAPAQGSEATPTTRPGSGLGTELVTDSVPPISVPTTLPVVEPAIPRIDLPVPTVVP